MGRWKPNAGSRLQQAAIELYNERGFDQTTAAAIAERAGLTERTFFRHFADKREVLFWGEDSLHELLALAVAAAPDSASPMDAVAKGLRSTVAIYFQTRPRKQAQQRQAVIAANAGLQERELAKLAKLASAVSDSLRRRGVPEPAASLAAEAGVAVFKIAVARWIDDTTGAELSQHLDESLAELQALTAHV